MKAISKRLKLSGCVLVLALASGCSPLVTNEGVPSSRWLSLGHATLNDVRSFQDLLNRSAPAELTKQYNTLSAIPAKTRGEFDTLKLALLLSQPGFPGRNDAAALKMLQESELHLPADSELAPFIRWYRTSLQERVQLAASADDANAQLLDEKKQTDACNDKLQAIRKMEDSLIERNRH